MLDLSKYKCAVFDCDGVILDSNHAKTNAFRQTVQHEPLNLVNAFIEYHQKHGGVSRYHKFEYFYRELKAVADYKGEAEKAVQHYSRLSYQALLDCEIIPGIVEFLKQLQMIGIPCAVVSGGAQDEVREVLERKGLKKYFKYVFGSPTTKLENMDLLNQNKFIQLPGVFFGDAYKDYEAAQKFGLDFIFVSDVSEWRTVEEFRKNNYFPSIKDFNSLLYQ